MPTLPTSNDATGRIPLSKMEINYKKWLESSDVHCIVSTLFGHSAVNAFDKNLNFHYNAVSFVNGKHTNQVCLLFCLNISYVLYMIHRQLFLLWVLYFLVFNYDLIIS